MIRAFRLARLVNDHYSNLVVLKLDGTSQMEDIMKKAKGLLLAAIIVLSVGKAQPVSFSDVLSGAKSLVGYGLSGVKDVAGYVWNFGKKSNEFKAENPQLDKAIVEDTIPVSPLVATVGVAALQADVAGKVITPVVAFAGMLNDAVLDGFLAEGSYGLLSKFGSIGGYVGYIPWTAFKLLHLTFNLLGYIPYGLNWLVQGLISPYVLIPVAALLIVYYVATRPEKAKEKIGKVWGCITSIYKNINKAKFVALCNKLTSKLGELTDYFKSKTEETVQTSGAGQVVVGQPTETSEADEQTTEVPAEAPKEEAKDSEVEDKEIKKEDDKDEDDEKGSEDKPIVVE